MSLEGWGQIYLYPELTWENAAMTHQLTFTTELPWGGRNLPQSDFKFYLGLRQWQEPSVSQPAAPLWRMPPELLSIFSNPMAASEHLLNPKLLLQPDLVCLQLLHWPLQCASSNQALSQLNTLTQASSHLTHYPWFCGQPVLHNLIFGAFFMFCEGCTILPKVCAQADWDEVKRRCNWPK